MKAKRHAQTPPIASAQLSAAEIDAEANATMSKNLTKDFQKILRQAITRTPRKKVHKRTARKRQGPHATKSRRK